LAKLKKWHWKAIEMLRTNKLSVSDIATSVGKSADHLYDLMAGSGKSGTCGPLFQAEYHKVTKVIEERTQKKVAEAVEKCVSKLTSWINAQRDCDDMSKMKHKQMVDTLKVLAQSGPSVNIETFSWTMLKGDDLINEFKRIASVARQSALRRGVQGAAEGGAGQVPEGSIQADSQGEGLQDTGLYPKSEAGSLPQESGEDTGYFRRKPFRKDDSRGN